MAHLAMLVPTWVGHLNPMTTLGRELARRGHRVQVLSLPDSEPRVTRAGLEFLPIGADAFPVGAWERRTTELATMSGLKAGHFTIRWIGRMTEVWLAELADCLTAHAFDGLVADQVCYGAEVVAGTIGLPHVVACNALPVYLQSDVPVHSETWPRPEHPLAVLRNRLMQRLVVTLAGAFTRPIRNACLARGQRFDVWHHMNELPPSLAHIAQLPACLDFPRSRAPDHFHHTGPWHEPGATNTNGFDWDRLDGRPLLYASLGTLQNRLGHLYQTILDAVAELPFQTVLTLGRDDGPRPERVPDNAIVCGYGPQLALLERASLVVTHAGLNTTLESLARGLPMAAMPITNEQPGIAARIRHAGVGDFVPIRGLTPAKLRALIERVHGGRYRDRARTCAAELARANGLQRAADIVERAIAGRRRVTRDEVAGPPRPAARET